MKSLTIICLFSILLFITACSHRQPYTASLHQSNASSTPQSASCDQSLMGPLTYDQYFPAARHLSQFVRRIHEDRNGNMWFGTNGNGVIRYSGGTLRYFSFQQNFPAAAVRGILEDDEGNLWFGTENGLIKYDPKKPDGFINFNTSDGLVHNDIWSLYIDKAGIIWAGTLQGISRFDGTQFSAFELPETQDDPRRGVTSTRIVHSIMEDHSGRMWFGTNGGAFVYDGKTLSNISEKDGLCGNIVNDILEDEDGNFWFATHHNGVCRWDGTSFVHFAENNGVNGNEVWSLFQDSEGGIWFPSEGYGLYRYNGKSFVHYHVREGLSSNAIQCVYEDSEGKIWCGGWMGLFRLDGQHFIPVNKNGPWEDGC